MQFLDNNTLLLSKKVMDFLWQKQVVTADNISNSETPGYKAKYVTFEDELKKHISAAKNRTSQDIRRGIELSRAEVNLTNDEATRTDGNNVSVDVESAELSKSGIHYEYMLKAYNDDITRLRTVIKGN